MLLKKNVLQWLMSYFLGTCECIKTIKPLHDPKIMSSNSVYYSLCFLQVSSEAKDMFSKMEPNDEH